MQTFTPSFLRPLNLLHQLQNLEKCSTGCQVIDGFIGGGFPANSITEIYSESGLGKTQLFLQTALQTASPQRSAADGGSAIYNYTDFAFPHRILNQLAQRMAEHHYLSQKELTSRVHVIKVSSVTELFLELQLAELLIREARDSAPVKLIIVDSIASMFTSQFCYTPADMAGRMNLFFRISATLKSMAHEYNLVVLVTNGVVDYFAGRNSPHTFRIGNLQATWSTGRQVTLALGMSWVNCVNTRIFLSRDAVAVLDALNGGAVVVNSRMIHVIISPLLPLSSLKLKLMACEEGEGFTKLLSMSSNVWK